MFARDTLHCELEKGLAEDGFAVLFHSMSKQADFLPAASDSTVLVLFVDAGSIQLGFLFVAAVYPCLMLTRRVNREGSVEAAQKGPNQHCGGNTCSAKSLACCESQSCQLCCLPDWKSRNTEVRACQGPRLCGSALHSSRSLRFCLYNADKWTDGLVLHMDGFQVLLLHTDCAVHQGDWVQFAQDYKQQARTEHRPSIFRQQCTLQFDDRSFWQVLTNLPGGKTSSLTARSQVFLIFSSDCKLSERIPHFPPNHYNNFGGVLPDCYQTRQQPLRMFVSGRRIHSHCGLAHSIVILSQCEQLSLYCDHHNG